MAETVKQAGDRMYGIINAIMHPGSYETPTYGECEEALNKFNDACDAEAEALATPPTESRPS